MNDGRTIDLGEGKSLDKWKSTALGEGTVYLHKWQVAMKMNGRRLNTSSGLVLTLKNEP